MSVTLEFCDKMRHSTKGRPFEKRSYLNLFMEEGSLSEEKNVVKGIPGRERKMNKSLEEESCHHFSTESLLSMWKIIFNLKGWSSTS